MEECLARYPGLEDCLRQRLELYAALAQVGRAVRAPAVAAAPRPARFLALAAAGQGAGSKAGRLSLLSRSAAVLVGLLLFGSAALGASVASGAVHIGGTIGGILSTLGVSERAPEPARQPQEGEAGGSPDTSAAHPDGPSLERQAVESQRGSQPAPQDYAQEHAEAACQADPNAAVAARPCPNKEEDAPSSGPPASLPLVSIPDVPSTAGKRDEPGLEVRGEPAVDRQPAALTPLAPSEAVPADVSPVTRPVAVPANAPPVSLPEPVPTAVPPVTLPYAVPTTPPSASLPVAVPVILPALAPAADMPPVLPPVTQAPGALPLALPRLPADDPSTDPPGAAPSGGKLPLPLPESAPAEDRGPEAGRPQGVPGGRP